MTADATSGESISLAGSKGNHLSQDASEAILQRAKIGSHRVGQASHVDCDLGHVCGVEPALLDPFDDAVFRPRHYTCRPLDSMQIIEAVVPPYGDVHELAPFYIGVVLQYLYRAPHKGTCKQDLQKACWYLNRLVEALP